MKERPILFQGAMVRAILAGTKTQTRRAVKPQPANDPAKHHPIEPYRTSRGDWNWVLAATGHGTGDPFPCPYGAPGDRLWVREAFMHEPADYCWEASVSIPSRPASTVYRADFPQSKPGEGWKPSIHMPRKLCRLELEVTGVRVERLQAIREEDAIAEGCITEEVVSDYDGSTIKVPAKIPHPSGVGFQGWDTARDWYADLWEAINGTDSWDANPWVWVVEFRKAVA